jgi:hypothetical protein
MKTIQWILLAGLIASGGVVYAKYGDSCYKDCQCDKGEWCDKMGDFQWSGWGQCVRGDNPDNNSVKTAAPGSCKN